uniref:FHA domain-containing protein n=1 Tax=Podarcis muralis TaxID=64176 RepID=A0A670IT11_PODMU
MSAATPESATTGTNGQGSLYLYSLPRVLWMEDFWIYPGENVIGRLESCQVCLPAASVSKTHAVIEVPSHRGPHLLYDLGSLNRTRRQRMVLIPHVRYSLQDGDALLFGDVGCQYFSEGYSSGNKYSGTSGYVRIRLHTLHVTDSANPEIAPRVKNFASG